MKLVNDLLYELRKSYGQLEHKFSFLDQFQIYETSKLLLSVNIGTPYIYKYLQSLL